MSQSNDPAYAGKNHSTAGTWDSAYEWKAVILLSLGFGLVGVDRFLIMPLYPVIMKSLDLGYQDLGLITGALSLGWGIAAIFMGNLSDHIGHRRVIIPAIILFSILAGLSGAATGVLGLIAIRILMGFLEGAYTPPSIVATMDASKPSRHGRNVGLQQMLGPLFGLALAPVLVTHLFEFMSWRYIFAIVSAPGLIVAFFLWKYLRNTAPEAAALHTKTHDANRYAWRDIFKYHNIPFNIIGMFCWLTCLVVLTAFLPSYLTSYLHFSIPQMGYVLSGIGIGSTLGTFFVPMCSDYIGRKPVMILSVIGALIFLVLLDYMATTPGLFFLYLIGALFFIFGMIVLTVGPICVESVPATLMTSTSGVVVGFGEFFGGCIAPVIGGVVASKFGIKHIFDLGFVALFIGFISALCLKETLIKKQKQS